jgi:glucose-6-phosphate 1-dehydrogenase
MAPLATPTVLVIFGVTGDLARRKLLPALRTIAAAGVLPAHFRVVGVVRRPTDLTDVLPAGDDAFLRASVELFAMSGDEVSAFVALGERLDTIEHAFGVPAQRLFALSVPPDATMGVVERLGESGIAPAPRSKLLLEKPFGVDLASAEAQVAQLTRWFSEDAVYRIDHYLAKEMAQNLVVFRSENHIFRDTWHGECVDAVEIVAGERIGIEGRAKFYEQTGALRDLVQGHLLQLLALVLMELPAGDDWSLIPVARHRALAQLRPASPASAVRGQYRGYREEVANPASAVETFLSLTLTSADPRWAGVPLTLTTGKALDAKRTEIRLRYRGSREGGANELVLRIQPDEGVELSLWAKRPGYDRELQRVPLAFRYGDHFKELPEAYERVFVDAMRGDRGLFVTGPEVLAAWRALDPLQRAWAAAGQAGIVEYAQGSGVDEVLAKSPAPMNT